MRMKIAGALFLGLVSVAGFAPVAAAVPGTPTHYYCDARQRLVVSRTADSATVKFIDKTYQLRREHSDLGIKYLAPDAALIIDGASAVFVTGDRLQLGNCVEAPSFALER